VTSLLRIESLKKYYPIRTGMFSHKMLHAIDGVSFEIEHGETVGLVGESGSGKSTVAKCATMLERPTDGAIEFQGKNLTELSFNEMTRARAALQMVFQDPYDSLNPRRTVGQTVLEPIKIHKIASGQAAKDRVADLFERVGLRPEHMARYPHQLSGGQQQRVGIARALATNPDLIVLDEPTSALDVSVQAKLLRLLKNLQREQQLTYLFISHDLSVIGHLSDKVAVMYLGQIIEFGPTTQVFSRPRHPYTMALMSAVPAANPLERRQRIILTGEIPSPIEPPNHCRLVTRCPYATEECRSMNMELMEVEPGHTVACIRSVRGEIPIPTFLNDGPAVNLINLDMGRDSDAIADDVLLPVDEVASTSE
jgi:oligopeptide/dipeptide ABC transporter ATP-binding protein